MYVRERADDLAGILPALAGVDAKGNGVVGGTDVVLQQLLIHLRTDTAVTMIHGRSRCRQGQILLLFV